MVIVGLFYSGNITKDCVGLESFFASGSPLMSTLGNIKLLAYLHVLKIPNPGHFWYIQILMRALPVFLFFLINISAPAQEMLTYRPKISEFSLEGISSYEVTSTKRNNETNYTIDRDRLIKLRLGVPVILKEKTLFGVQLKYFKQSFNNNSFISKPDPLFTHLNENPLTNAGLNFLYQRKISETRKFSLMGVTEIASDNWELHRSTTRNLLAGEYSIQLNPQTAIAYGGVINNALGIWNIYPTFTYKKQLTSKILLEATLPKSINWRYHLNEKTFFIFQTEFNNWRYNVTNALPNEARLLTVQRADVYFKLQLEREIHDWLWFGVDLAYINNLSSFIVNPGDRQRKAIQEYDLTNSSYFRISLFLLPPEKLWNRL